LKPSRKRAPPLRSPPRFTASKVRVVTRDIVKELIRFDSPTAIVAILLVVTIWWWRRPSSRGPQRLLVAVLVVFYLAATPIGSGALMYGLAHGFRPVDAREAAGADAVVVLGGGIETVVASNVVLGHLTTTTTLRALEGARAYKVAGARLVVVSGGIANPKLELTPEAETMAAALVEAGVPADRVLQDREAKTTHDHPRTVAPLLREHQVRRFVLVTSPTHMRRALAVFRKAGFDPVPSVSPVRSEHIDAPPWLLPNDDSLAISNQAVYDYVAWVDYWLRGWL
jgi:uncharacterized SAM-binding protein YcdF (DUF218 family)